MRRYMLMATDLYYQPDGQYVNYDDVIKLLDSCLENPRRHPDREAVYREVVQDIKTRMEANQ